MKCIKCLETIHYEATKCHHCKSWQSRTGEIPRRTENIIMGVLFSILMIPVTYIANDMAEDRFSELGFSARWMVLEENSKKKNASKYSDSDVNIFNYYKLTSRYDEITSSIDNSYSSDILSCLSSKGENCKGLDITKEGKFTVFNLDEKLISQDAIVYLTNIAMNLKIIGTYGYGRTKIKVIWS
jgi:hypothetical protein